MMQQAAKEQQRMAQEQQKLFSQQQKQFQQSYLAKGQPSAVSQINTSAGHHASHLQTATTHQVLRQHYYLYAWPHHSSSAYYNLLRLKHDLDRIGMNGVVSNSHRLALRNDLLRVAEPRPRPPLSHVQILANDLALAMSTRSVPQVNTGLLAIQLRAMLHGARLSPQELDLSLSENRAILTAAGAPAPAIEAVMGDLRTIAGELKLQTIVW
jgi:hypothetical protein